MSGDLPDAVLFVCSRNAVRSPMASALTRHVYGSRIYVASVGVSPGEPDSIAIQVMSEIGVDISGRRPRGVDALEETTFDLVVALAPDARGKAEALAASYGATMEYWPTPDPTAFEGSREMRLAAYRELRDSLMARIEARFGDEA